MTTPICSVAPSSMESPCRAHKHDLFLEQPSTTDASEVPERMLLSQSLRANIKSLLTIPLIPLNCTFGVVNEKAPVPFRSALRKEGRKANGKMSDISVVFVVRRPGCSACREHGQQLTELASEIRDASFWSIVKETGVEEQGILTFFQDYFRFPMYKDEKWLTYKAMGDRKLTPMKLLKRFLSAKGRWEKKGIPNRLKGGDLWVQGGVLIYQKSKLRYAYEEKYAKELNIGDIRAAIMSLQQEDDMTCSDMSEESVMSFTQTRIEI